MTDTENQDQSGEDNGAPVLSEDEQKEVAIEWFFAMWDEAMKRGVDPEKMAIVSLSGTLNKFVAMYGEEGASALVEQIPERIMAGHFTPKGDQESH